MKKIISCGLCMAVLLTGCQVKTPPKEDRAQVSIQHYEATAPKAYPVEKRDFEAVKNAPANYQGAETTNMYFGMNQKKITAIYFNQGAEVKAGDIIMEMECDDVKEQIADVEQQIKTAKLEKEYYNKQIKSLTGDEKEQYKISFDAIEKTIALYQQQLGDLKEQLTRYQIIAPYDCVIRLIPTEAYECYTYEMEFYNHVVACVLENMDKGFYVNGDSSYPYEVGQTAYVEYAGAKIDVKLTEIQKQSDTMWVLKYDPLVDVPVKGDGAQDESGTLYQSFGTVKNALVVYKNCVLTIGEEKYVYVVDEEGHFTPRMIEIGKTDGTYYEIKDGVKEGEMVLYE